MSHSTAVIINCLSSQSGGALNYVRNVVPRLLDRSSRKCEIHVLASNEQRSKIGLDGLSRISWLNGRPSNPYLRQAWDFVQVRRMVRSLRAGVVFTPYQIGPLLSGVKNVLMLRNMEPFLCSRYEYSWRSSIRNHILMKATARSLVNADRVIAVSSFAAAQAEALGVGVEKIRRVYHGSPDYMVGDAVVEQRALASLGIDGDFILTCGSLLPYRRLEDVVAAYGRLCETISDAPSLVVAGSGNDKRYGAVVAQVVSQSGVRDRIRFLGHVPWDVMGLLYRRSVLVAIATEIEACPNIAIEAMAAGSAIVAADCPPLPEIFGGCALAFKARDVDGLRDAMLRVLNSPVLRTEQQSRARVRANEFCWERCADQTMEALRSW